MHNPKEILAVVDEDDKIIGKNNRLEIHKKGLLHRESILLLWNEEKLLLQLRTDNGEWDASVGCHVEYLENAYEAIKRECKEEIGVEIENIDLLFKIRLQDKHNGFDNNRFLSVHTAHTDLKLKDFSMEKDEIAELKYFTKKQVLELIRENKTTSSIAKAVEKLII